MFLAKMQDFPLWFVKLTKIPPSRVARYLSCSIYFSVCCFSTKHNRQLAQTHSVINQYKKISRGTKLPLRVLQNTRTLRVNRCARNSKCTTRTHFRLMIYKDRMRETRTASRSLQPPKRCILRNITLSRCRERLVDSCRRRENFRAVIRPRPRTRCG